MNTANSANSDPARAALVSLVNREEVLQICYWFQGEGVMARPPALGI